MAKPRPVAQDRETGAGKKVTVYLKASQVRHLKESGLMISDVVQRGFAVTPISADGTVPEEYRAAMEYISRTAAVLANGGHVFTSHATPEAVEAALGIGISDREQQAQADAADLA